MRNGKAVYSLEAGQLQFDTPTKKGHGEDYYLNKKNNDLLENANIAISSAIDFNHTVDTI